MKESVKTCSCCGLACPNEVLRYRNGLPICIMCEYEYIIEETRKNNMILYPSYFINTSHATKFYELLNEVYVEQRDNSDYVLAAYINSLPAIYNNVDMKLCKYSPFLWKYRFAIFEYIQPTGKTEEIRVSISGFSDVYCLLNEDYKKIVDLSEYLMNSVVLYTDSRINEIMKDLSNIGKPIAYEIFRFYFI